jgi:hypothetical protein
MTRTQINQANAQHSTGPKTKTGKQRSSLNALRHGLTGQIIVLPVEDREACQRLPRQFEKTLALLKQLQSTRLANEGHELNQAANLVQMHRMEEEPYDPASDPGKDDFVFSDEEIEARLARDDRDQRAADAEDYCLEAA